MKLCSHSNLEHIDITKGYESTQLINAGRINIYASQAHSVPLTYATLAAWLSASTKQSGLIIILQYVMLNVLCVRAIACLCLCVLCFRVCTCVHVCAVYISMTLTAVTCNYASLKLSYPCMSLSSRTIIATSCSFSVPPCYVTSHTGVYHAHKLVFSASDDDQQYPKIE